MIKFGELNNISKELLDQVPKLGPKDSAEYRLLNRRPDPENKGMWLIPYMKGVESRVMITDPYTQDISEIAYIKRIKSKTTKSGRVDEPDIVPIVFTREQAGTIILHGSKAEDRLLHEFLYLSPQNAISPLSDPNIMPVYEYVDVKANAKKGIDKMKNKMKAMTFISNLKPIDGLFDYAYMVSRIETKDEDVARYQLGEFAESDPDRFFEIVESVDSDIKITYLRAMAQGVLSYDATTGTVRWAKSQEIITTIPKAVKQREDAFAMWAKTGAANMKLVDTIKAMLKKDQPSKYKEPVSEPATVEEFEDEVIEEPKPKRGRPKKES